MHAKYLTKKNFEILYGGGAGETYVVHTMTVIAELKIKKNVYNFEYRFSSYIYIKGGFIQNVYYEIWIYLDRLKSDVFRGG